MLFRSSKGDVQQVATVSETGAYGVMISKNTFEIGISANDAEAQEIANGQPGQGKPSALEAAQLQLVQLELQQRQAEIQQRQAEKSYGVKQFVEPNQTQGIPSRFVGQTPSNQSGGSVFPTTPARRLASKIGRASCRERVYSGV